jgi:hypothetical protein
MDFLMMADLCLGFGVCIVGKELRISTSSRCRHKLSHPTVYNSSDNLSWSVHRSTLLPKVTKTSGGHEIIRKSPAVLNM